MKSVAQINICIDEQLKEKAEVLFGELGMTMSTAINIFIRQSVRIGGLPFEVTTQTDPFFSQANMRVLQKSIMEINEKKYVSKTLDELKDLED